MHNFARVIRLALRQRASLVGIVSTSVLVGLLWGANIGVAYPFMEVVFNQESMHAWIEGQISEAERSVGQRRRAWQARREQPAGMPTGARATLEGWSLGLRERCLAAARQTVPHLPDQPFGSLVLIVVMLILGTLLKGIFLVTNMLLVERLAQLTTLELRNQFYRHTLQLELSAFGEGRTGELMSRFTNDVNNLTAGLSTLFGKSLREPLKMLVCLAGAALISWRLLLISLLVAPLALLLMYYLARSIKRANRRAMEEMARIYERLSESLAGIRVVKAFTMERVERSRFLQVTRQLYYKSLRIVFYGSLTRLNNELLGVGVICLALLAGGYLVLTGETRLLGIPITDRPFALPTMMLFYGLLVGISDPARKMSEVFGQLQKSAAAADRVYALLDREPAIVDPVDPKPVPAGPCDVVFDHVTFHYHPSQTVLDDVSLRVTAGETVAVVGPNGSGKSTLTNLLLRFYDPVQGAVRLNYTDLRDLRLRDLRRTVGIVTQQTTLFDDTVANNIRYGSPHASLDDVVRAARRAHAHAFIDRLPDGYDTRVGEGGSKLSGGQRQRLTLARAILRDPSILILDEATSQIDQESEQLIHQALVEFLRDRTTLIITHRTSTLALVDRILVLDQGRLVDQGRHDELDERCPLYRRLYQDLRHSA